MAWGPPLPPGAIISFEISLTYNYVLFNFQMFWEFPVVFVIDFQFDSIIVKAHTLYNFNYSTFVKVCFTLVFFFFYLINVLQAIEKKCILPLLDDLLHMLIRSCWFCHSDNLYPCDILPNSSMSCWMEEVLTFPTIIDFSFFFQLYQLLLHVFEALWFNFYTLVYSVFLEDWSFLIH